MPEGYAVVVPASIEVKASMIKWPNLDGMQRSAMYESIGCTMVVMHSASGMFHVWLDEDGFLKGLPGNPRATRLLGFSVVGTAIVTPYHNGEDSPGFFLDDASIWVTCLNDPSA